MDVTNEKEQKKERTSPLARELSQRSKSESALDIAVALCALLFARCHIVFGAHPCAIALLAVLPCRVWYALAGAVIGSLTLGKAGIIYSMIAVIVVFLRVIISGGERTEDGVVRRPFSEKILLRICTSVIGGFIITVYELLLSGFTKTSVLFGLSMILIPPTLTFLLCGLFDSGITPAALLRAGSSIFTNADEGRRMTLIFFRISAATLILIISISLSDLELLGISCAYIFAAFTTLAVSKRFGALHGAVAGFASALGLSPLYAASYALAGIAAGLLFRLGVTYALVGACAVMSLWSTYTSGLTGLLSTFPEYVIGASIAFPLLKKLPTEHSEEVRGTEKTAQDMVGTMALAFQNRYTGSLDALESSLSELSGVIAAFGRGGRIRAEEYRDMIIEEADRFCRSCAGLRVCISEDMRPFINNATALAERLEHREKLSAADVSVHGSPCEVAEHIADSINRRASAMEEERYRLCETVAAAEDYSAISRMINEARMHDEAERAMDTALSEKLGEVFRSCGFPDGTIRVFGERKKHVICAGEDEDGSRITNPELLAGIERVSGVRMGTPEYFRRGRLVLMECTAEPSYVCEHATASVAGSEREISGDTAICLTCADGRFISLISDGMGSGEIAMQTSSFVADFLRGMLFHGYSKDTVLHVLNGLIRARGEECSATVDIFELDLINAEAQFIKSGAAASYVKRDSSIFRIRSRTAPIGLMKAVDAERIRVEIKSGDYVIMLSDGVNQSPEEAPWLIELLSKPPKRNLQEYADSILAAAIRNNPPRDDMTVTVVRISARA